MSPPTRHLPGTWEKVLVLSRRASKRRPLFLPGDSPVPSEGGPSRPVRADHHTFESVPDRYYQRYLNVWDEDIRLREEKK